MIQSSLSLSPSLRAPSWMVVSVSPDVSTGHVSSLKFQGIKSKIKI